MGRGQALGVTGVVALFLGGCGGATQSAPPAPSPTVPPTPTLHAQILRAQRVGPGFLNYCPLHNGRETARYSIDAPGGGRVTGWCATHAIRRSESDLITFTAHWDARKRKLGQGTIVLTYGVPKEAAPSATPVPNLLRQSGTLPP